METPVAAAVLETPAATEMPVKKARTETAVVVTIDLTWKAEAVRHHDRLVDALDQLAVWHTKRCANDRDLFAVVGHFRDKLAEIVDGWDQLFDPEWRRGLPDTRGMAGHIAAAVHWSLLEFAPAVESPALLFGVDLRAAARELGAPEINTKAAELYERSHKWAALLEATACEWSGAEAVRCACPGWAHAGYTRPKRHPVLDL